MQSVKYMQVAAKRHNESIFIQIALMGLTFSIAAVGALQIVVNVISIWSCKRH